VSLRLSLNAVIDDHTRYPYTSSSTDTWDILDVADEDPMNPANVLDVYKNASYPKAGAGNANYNREHRWAKSYGFPDDSSSSWAYTDIHHLIVANSGYNSARNNRYFDHCADSCTEYPTDLTNGIGGGSGVYPGNSNWGKGDRWEVWGFRKGDVARALLYMDVRYEGGTNTFGAPEPDLVMTNNPALIQTTGTNTTGTAYLGLLCVLVEWHRADPPDEQERLRNALVQTFQNNRNPFVDHPEWADTLFNAECPRPDALFQDGFD
jgi:endonuclease I